MQQLTTQSRPLHVILAYVNRDTLQTTSLGMSQNSAVWEFFEVSGTFCWHLHCAVLVI